MSVAICSLTPNKTAEPNELNFLKKIPLDRNNLMLKIPDATIEKGKR